MAANREVYKMKHITSVTACLSLGATSVALPPQENYQVILELQTSFGYSPSDGHGERPGYLTRSAFSRFAQGTFRMLVASWKHSARKHRSASIVCDCAAAKSVKVHPAIVK